MFNMVRFFCFISTVFYTYNIKKHTSIMYSIMFNMVSKTGLLREKCFDEFNQYIFSGNIVCTIKFI